MFRTLKLISLLALCAGFISKASADILLEPYVGYYFGKAKTNSSSNFSGPGFGARVGYKTMLGLSAGAEYMTGKMKQDSTPSVDITPNSLGAFVAFDFPVLLRVYGTYFISDKSDGKSNTGTNKYSGNKGVKLGVGFTGLPFVSVNLEYGASEFDKVNGSAAATSLKTNYYGLSVSLPLTF